MQPKNFKESLHKKFTTAEQAILITLLYSDIFDFPLTEDELWKFLIAEKKVTRDGLRKGLKLLKKHIVCKNNYYCLYGREMIITKRINNREEVKKKMLLARKIAKKLTFIPSIYFIGISGGLAAGNANKDDDVDLVIITEKNLLFSTRLLILFTLEFLGVRRSRNQKILQIPSVLICYLMKPNCHGLQTFRMSILPGK